eukprot:PhM_4_TR4273/c0_g1_i1/m.98878/K06632/WEE1; wee1-like protein kinase
MFAEDNANFGPPTTPRLGNAAPPPSLTHGCGTPNNKSSSKQQDTNSNNHVYFPSRALFSSPAPAPLSFGGGCNGSMAGLSNNSNCQGPATPRGNPHHNSHGCPGSEPWGMPPPTPAKPMHMSRPKGNKVKRLRAEDSLTQRIQVLRLDSDGSQGDASPPAATNTTAQQQQPPYSQTSQFSQATECLSQSYSQQHVPALASHGYHMDFHELDVLGSGSFGKVYAVERRFDGQRFAIKHVQEKYCSAREHQRKLLEVRAMGIACQGPHVVQLHHTWAEGSPSTMYILMELCPGGSLQQRARTQPPPGEAEALDVLGQLALSIYACHSRHIVHGDFKLENIYYDANGRLRLGDFGLASFLDPMTGYPVSYRVYETTQEHSHMWSSRENTEVCSQEDGDARYISIDMLNERQHYKPGDIFSLGMSLFELLSGQPLPRNGDDHMQLRTTDAATHRLLATKRYSLELVHLIQSMLAMDPLQRPSVEDILQHRLLRMDSMAMSSPEGTGPTTVGMSLRQTLAECEFYRIEMQRKTASYVGF